MICRNAVQYGPHTVLGSFALYASYTRLRVTLLRLCPLSIDLLFIMRKQDWSMDLRKGFIVQARTYYSKCTLAMVVES